MPHSDQNNSAKMAAWKKATATAKNSWKTARTAKPGGGFEEVSIEDGRYKARMKKATFDLTSKKKVPYIACNLLILEGDYEGTKLRQTYFMTDDDEDRQIAKQEGFAKAMAAMGYNVEEIDIQTEAADLVEDLNKDRPFVEINVVNWQGDKSHGYNAYINRLLTEDEVSELNPQDDDGDDDDDKPQRKPSPKEPSHSPKKVKAGRRR